MLSPVRLKRWMNAKLAKMDEARRQADKDAWVSIKDSMITSYDDVCAGIGIGWPTVGVEYYYEIFKAQLSTIRAANAKGIIEREGLFYGLIMAMQDKNYDAAWKIHDRLFDFVHANLPQSDEGKFVAMGQLIAPRSGPRFLLHDATRYL